MFQMKVNMSSGSPVHREAGMHGNHVRLGRLATVLTVAGYWININSRVIIFQDFQAILIEALIILGST